MTDRFRVPKQNFFTPEDATTWDVILQARYWNDRMEDMLNFARNADVKIESKDVDGSVDAKTFKYSRDIKRELPFQQIPYSQAKYKRQKPNLFGNSIVSMKVLNDINPQVKKEVNTSLKRPRMDTPAETNASSVKRSK